LNIAPLKGHRFRTLLSQPITAFPVSAFDNSRLFTTTSAMPKIKTTRTKKPPEGFEDIEEVRFLCGLCHDPLNAHFFMTQILDDYAKKMRDAENESHEGKRKSESLWPIMRISHTRSRYIYDLYYKREAISKELYDWLLKQGYADAK
jgi:bud site selection protein 31